MARRENFTLHLLDTKESYELAKANYQTAFLALENARNNGSAILKAIRAHQDALKMRDKAAKSKTVDASFMNELTSELTSTQAELRSDRAIENDLDAMKPGSLDSELAKMDAATVDDALMVWQSLRLRRSSSKDSSNFYRDSKSCPFLFPESKKQHLKRVSPWPFLCTFLWIGRGVSSGFLVQ